MRSSGARAARWAAVGGVLVFGFSALVWSAYTLPAFWRERKLADAAQHIISGDKYRPTALAELQPFVERIGRDEFKSPTAYRDAAVFVLQDLERSFASRDRPDLDSKMEELDRLIRLSFANAPADPFLWAVFFWLQNTRDGYSAEHLKYLRMSYSTGPQEGWISAKRNRFSLALFSQLPEDLKNTAAKEFARLVESGFYREAADILTGPGWPVRDMLLSGLDGVPEADRQLFARIVYQLGYDVVVPGIVPRGQRPWN